MNLEINHDPSYSIPGQYQVNFSFLKGQSNQIFDLHFFPYSKLLGPLTNGKKYLSILVQISRKHLNFGFKKMTHWGMIPLGVMFRQIFMDSPGYDRGD